MKIIISPAKSQDFNRTPKSFKTTMPQFINRSELLIKELRKLNKNDIGQLMSLSENLSNLNYDRFKKWNINFKNVETSSALFCFTGAVYETLSAETMKPADFSFVNKSLRIMSGLYGILKPSDLIMPYRLEMSIPLKTKSTKNLYEFWKDILTKSFIEEIKNDKDQTLINLASTEYSKALDLKKFPIPVITPVFKENKDGKLKTIAIFAKKARGAMTRFIVDNKVRDVNDIKSFNWKNYKFDSVDEKRGEWLFVR